MRQIKTCAFLLTVFFNTSPLALTFIFSALLFSSLNESVINEALVDKFDAIDDGDVTLSFLLTPSIAL